MEKIGIKVDTLVKDMKIVKKEMECLLKDVETLKAKDKNIEIITQNIVNNALQEQLCKIRVVVSEELDKRELEEHRDKQKGSKEIKTHATKAFLTWGITIFCGVALSLVCFGLTMQNLNNQDLIHYYEAKILDLQEQISVERGKTK